jgi:hypothetical protein
MSRYCLLILCFVLFALIACSENLFGSPGNNNCGENIKCLRSDAENAFRSGNYAKAYNIYAQIVKIDSTASAGYFGMAKSGLWMKGVNPFEVLAHVKKEEGEVSFMNEDPRDQNRFYQGMRYVVPALRELEKRDSLTTHYYYHMRNRSGALLDTTFILTTDSASWIRIVKENGYDTTNIESIDNGKDKTYKIPLKEKLKKLRETYCKLDENCSGIPFSDYEYRYNTYSGGLLITTISEKILKSLDTNKDGCIAKRCPKDVEEDNPAECTKDDNKYNPGDTSNHQKWKNWGCDMKSGKYSYDLTINLTINDSGRFEVDVNNILNELDLEDTYIKQLTDPYIDLPPDIKDFNDKMDEFNESMYEIISAMGKFKDKNSSDEVPFGWENDVGEYKDYSTFYKIGTHIDEDGDGCIDEDILDGQDNDGDGLKNGNARLASVDTNDVYYANDGLLGLHGMTGNPDDDKVIRINLSDPAFKPIYNNPEHTIRADLNPDEDGWVNVIAFTQKEGYWTSDNRDDKLMIAQDTVCPPKFSLEERKALIGGCWLFYDDNKFVKYWLKRELARKTDRDKRVHSTCNNCTTTAGCLGK